jgi:predicted metalloprotease with PDZ domain
LKHRRGHFIGNIDVGSPAEAAGLRQNDRIIEVNGINVANENHYQVVERIKAVLTETRLLVVDQATDDYYKDKVVLNGDMPNIVYLENKPENDSPDNSSTGEMTYTKANGEDVVWSHLLYTINYVKYFVQILVIVALHT